MKRYPREVKCPSCGAAKGYGCHTPVLFRLTSTHAARWKAVGIPHPTLQQRADANNIGAYHDRCLLLNKMPGAMRLVLGL